MLPNLISSVNSSARTGMILHPEDTSHIFLGLKTVKNQLYLNQLILYKYIFKKKPAV